VKIIFPDTQGTTGKEKMKLAKKAMIGASMALAVSSAVLVGAAPAHAEVWNCRAYIEHNVGVGLCEAGFGPYQVRVSCASAHWPYTREIHGPVVNKPLNGPGPESRISGSANGCHVTSAWVAAL
jgi:hypothetical protein